METVPAATLKRGDIISFIPTVLEDEHTNPIDLTQLHRWKVQSIMPVPAKRMAQRNAVAQYSLYLYPLPTGDLTAKRVALDANVFKWPA